MKRTRASGLRAVVDATPIAIVVIDTHGNIAITNRQAETLFGYDAAELLGKATEILVPERFRALHIANRIKYLLAPASRTLTAEHGIIGARKDGSEVPLEIGLNPVRTRKGRFVLATISDITERTNAVERKHVEEQLRLVIDGAANAMVVADLGGRITLVNSQVEKMFGYLPHELLDRSVDVLLPDWKGEVTPAILDETETDPDGRLGAGSDRTGLHKLGHSVSLDVVLRNLKTSKGPFLLASFIDTTARKHADELRLSNELHAAELEALKAEIESVEVSLQGSKVRLHRQAERLASLWRIVNTPTLRGSALVLAMLKEAAAAMRPGQAYFGILGHVEGQQYVIDAVSGDLGPPGGSMRRFFEIGKRIDLSDTVHARTLDAHRTQGWEDLQSAVDLPAHIRESGLRSQIRTQFVVGETLYILTLATLEAPTGVAFSADDYAYIEVLASVFERQLELGMLEASLRNAELRARQHAERLEALWRVANNLTLRGYDLALAMLRQAAAAIRPGQRFSGVLGRIEGGEVVVIGVGVDSDGNAPGAKSLQVGARTPLTSTIIGPDVRTRAYDDLALWEIPPQEVARLGWRAVLSTQFYCGQTRYALTFASTEPTTVAFGPQDSAYIEVLAASFANQLQVTQLEDSLRDEEERARQHADRLETLWTLVNNPRLRDEELWQAMLAEAAAAIQPGQGCRAVLWSVRGEEIVLEAVANSPGYPSVNPFQKIGSTLRLDETVVGKVIMDGGGTRSWDDLQTSTEASSLARTQATHAFAVTTFGAGGTTWALSFASNQIASKTFGRQERSYIEMLASFFANHVQQRWQFDRIEFQQSHDVLTGLLNRSQFRSQARAAARVASHYAVLMVDINAFHEINESYGHMIGDALLVEVGNGLLRCSRDGDIVGRLGGDVFGVYLADPASADALRARVREFAEVFAQPFSTGDGKGKEFLARSASIGVALAPNDGQVIDAILARADAALFASKARGHGATVFYELGMEATAQRRSDSLTELAAAIAGNQFELHYQPHVEIRTGAVSGCEALIRWNHPQRGLLLPAQFIPFAEQTGMITAIDEWVMQNVFAAARELAVLGAGFRLYFNLSGRQAGSPNLIRFFTEAARAGVPLANVGVEITESDAMRDVEATRRVCRALHRLNVRIALDDFGIGYSSLSSLKRLPVDLVKIDQSFIAGLLTNPDDETIAETIISIAQYFRLESLAEGVEHREQADWLRLRNCRYIQGFDLCRPLPLDAFKAWVAAHERQRGPDRLRYGYAEQQPERKLRPVGGSGAPRAPKSSSRP